MKIQKGSTFADCNIGTLKSEVATFTFEKDGQSMWVENTPCLESPRCLAKTFDKATSNAIKGKILSIGWLNSGWAKRAAVTFK